MNKMLIVLFFVILLWSCGSAKVAKPLYTKAPKAEDIIEDLYSESFDFVSMSAKISGKYTARSDLKIYPTVTLDLDSPEDFSQLARK